MKNIEDLNFEVSSPEEVEEKTAEIEESLWAKLERTGKKITFAQDIIALYNYLKDENVAWYRKAIVIGALLYFIIPVDAIPDLSPLIGYLDDLGVITAVIKYMGSEILPYYNK